MEQKFSNREIKLMFDTLKETLQEHGTTHNEILTAVRTTNGKVADIQGWRERMNGGAVVAVSFMSVIVIPILGWAIYSILMIPEKIQDALSVYEKPND